MAPAPSKLEPRLVPSTGGECTHWRDGVIVATHQTGVFIEPNVDTTCFSIRSVEHNGDPDELEEDLIHFCDWAELRDTIDQFMKERAAEADGG